MYFHASKCLAWTKKWTYRTQNDFVKQNVFWMLAIKFWDAKWFKDKLIYNMCYILAPQQHVFYLIYIFLLIIQVVVPYHCVSSPKSNYAVLNSNHSYFLLVDNGTVGKYGGEIIFRKRLERFIAQQKISISKSQTLQILSAHSFSATLPTHLHL